MLRHLLMVLTALLLMVPSVQAEPLSVRDLSEAEDRFAANPRAVKDIGDPFVLKTEDGYQMFATGGPIGFFTWKSNDLVKFERTKALKKVSWAASDYWAPEVFAWQGKYVMLFTARQRSTGSLRTGIAFSDTPEGEYKDPLDAPLMDYGYATIDATLTTDAEGNPYLIYVRDISENRIGSGGESHIYGVRLEDDLLRLRVAAEMVEEGHDLGCPLGCGRVRAVVDAHVADARVTVGVEEVAHVVVALVFVDPLLVERDAKASRGADLVAHGLQHVVHLVVDVGAAAQFRLAPTHDLRDGKALLPAEGEQFRAA